MKCTCHISDTSLIVISFVFSFIPFPPRYHVPLCPYIPVGAKNKINKSSAPEGSKLSRHGTVDYWESSSRDQLGLVDATVDGKEAVFFKGSV